MHKLVIIGYHPLITMIAQKFKDVTRYNNNNRSGEKDWIS